MDVSDSTTIGQRLRRIRVAKGKSLDAVAELAGISPQDLSMLESGERSLDRLLLIVALAEAVGVAPSDLTKLPVPAPANGHTDATTEAIRQALDGIEIEHPGGMVLPVEVLQDRVRRIHAQRRACEFAQVATDLPGLIRDLHTTLNTGRDRGELLALAVYLHVHVTRLWLHVAAAPTDLLRRLVFLARRLAEEHGAVTTVGMAGFGVADVLLSAGAFQPGQAALNSIVLPPTTADTAGLVCLLSATHAFAAAVQGRRGDIAAPMAAAAEVAERFETTGAADSLGFVWVPTDAGTYRMNFALEADEPDQAVRIAQAVHPERHPFPTGQAHYWVHYGRALARMRDRHDDAVRALRTAEEIFPTKVRRDPMIREVIAGLTQRSRSDAMGGELARMAHRAGLNILGHA